MAKTILVVEDNELNLQLMVAILGHYGYEVLEARNGAQAVLIARRPEHAHQGGKGGQRQPGLDDEQRGELTQPGQATGVAVDQRHNLTLHLCPQPVLRRHPEIRLRLTGDIHAGKISFPFRRSHHEAARLRWRTSPGVRQNR